MARARMPITKEETFVERRDAAVRRARTELVALLESERGFDVEVLPEDEETALQLLWEITMWEFVGERPSRETLKDTVAVLKPIELLRSKNASKAGGLDGGDDSKPVFSPAITRLAGRLGVVGDAG